jgi:hypothetical protein
MFITNAGDVTVRGTSSRHVQSARLAAIPKYVVHVGRPDTPWRWQSSLLAPFELLALAWSVPVLVLLLMAPVGLALSGALWVARLIFGL